MFFKFVVLPFDTNVPMTSMIDEERRRFEKKDAAENTNTLQIRDDLQHLMSACGPSEVVCGANPIEINTDVQAIGYREPMSEDIQMRMNADDLLNPNLTGIEEWDYLERFNLKFNNILMVRANRQIQYLWHKEYNGQSLIFLSHFFYFFFCTE